MIKYLGSKRRLVPALTLLAEASGARTALDLFCGTTRVAQAWKRLGLDVTAVDSARVAHVLARCYVATDPATTSGLHDGVAEAVDRLNRVPGRPGYVTDTFCTASRYFRPENGARIDAVRDLIESEYAGTDLWPVLVTSLLEAADRVDSTTGLQMAYLKQWAPRAHQPLTLRVPELLAGPGRAVRGDACALAGTDELGGVDLAYLDPPYNQHRYDSNYHVWETIVAWDAPTHYGVACKRDDLRDPARRSPFNGRRTMAAALGGVLGAVRADVVVLSYNNESWLSFEQLLRPVFGAGPRGGPGLRLGPLRGRPDRHPQPSREEGRCRVPRAQHRVPAGGRGPGPGPADGGRRGFGAGWAGRWTGPSPCSVPPPAPRVRFDRASDPLPTWSGTGAGPATHDRHDRGPTYMGALDGRTAVITGAGRGIGREHALLFASEGANVVVNDLGGAVDGSGDDRSAAQHVVDEITASGGRAVANSDDVCDWEGGQRVIRTAVEAFGDLHVLVNNAGILRDRVLVNMSEADWDSVVHVHLKGHFVPTRHAAAYWRQQTKEGKEVKAAVINTSSTSGLLGNPGQSNYGAAKAGIAAFTVIAAEELIRYGVRVNAIAPAARTRMTEQTPGLSDIVRAPRDAAAFDSWAPANISPLAAYLATESCPATGRVFFVQGGQVRLFQPWTMTESIDQDDRWTVSRLQAEMHRLGG